MFRRSPRQVSCSAPLFHRRRLTPRTPHLATLASMLPGQKFDESRLVKPGDWDKLAADADDDDLLDFEARMESDFAALKAEVAAEKAKGETKSKAAKPKASETTATPQAD